MSKLRRNLDIMSSENPGPYTCFVSSIRYVYLHKTNKFYCQYEAKLSDFYVKDI